MKIIISPTKTMKRKAYTTKTYKPIFHKESLEIRSILQKYDKRKIKKQFKISDKLTDLVYNYYQMPKDGISAINLYDGLSFKNLKLERFDKLDYEFLQQHLYIMSAMYGALRPLDEINEYRLDYMLKFERDLYEYWHQPLQELLKDEKLIINLASNEFVKSIKHPNIINIHLLDEKGKNQATQAKIGRGNMLAYIVENRITDVIKLKKYNNLKYQFDEQRSDKYNYYFKKSE